MSKKLMCGSCDWRGTTEDTLEAPHPFSPGETLTGCPQCKEVNSMRRGCYFRGCLEEGNCGSPHPEHRYVWHCYAHSPCAL